MTGLRQATIPRISAEQACIVSRKNPWPPSGSERCAVSSFRSWPDENTLPSAATMIAAIASLRLRLSTRVVNSSIKARDKALRACGPVQRQYGNAGLNLIEENERRTGRRPVLHGRVLVALNAARVRPAYCSAFSISARCAFTMSTFSLYCSCGVVLIASVSSSMSCFLSVSGIVFLY